MKKSATLIFTLISTVGLFLVSGCSEKVSESQFNRPSLIILFVFDALRPDHLGCYGYHRETSPRIDAFASDSVVFREAISQSSLSAPSYMSIFTSLNPAVHLVNNPNPWEPDLYTRLADEIATFPEALQRHGWKTVGLHGGGVVSPMLGFGRGFDSYRPDFFFNFSTPYFQPDRVLDRIDRLLEETREGDDPLFLFLMHLICHAPYIHGPREINTRFLENPVEGLPVDRDGLLPYEDPAWGPYDEMSFWRDFDLDDPEHLEHLIALYDGSIYYADQIFGRLIDKLVRKGLYEDSLIILTSDHGQEFYEHGGTQHGRMFVEHLQVPLIVKFPGNAFAGRVINDPARLIDIHPTIFGVLGIEIDHPIQGLSLLPLLDGQGDYDPVISSYNLLYQGPDTIELDVYIRLVSDGYAYSNFPTDDREEFLFDIEQDPREQVNLVETDPETAERMRGLASENLAGNRAFRLAIDQGKSAPGEPDEELRRAMKALGYYLPE